MILAVTVGLGLALGSVTPIQSLSAEYLRALWKTSPMTASQVGYHKEGVDRRLDELTPSARARRAAWLHGFESRLETAAKKSSDREDGADAELLRQSIALELLDLDEAHDFSRRCDQPLDNLGSTFFMMTARSYAPFERRAQDVAARLGAVPRYLAEAQAGLTTDVDVFREAARDDGEGLIDYLQHDLEQAFKNSNSRSKIDAGVAQAVKAVRGYLDFVAVELPKRPKGTFRYGKALYDKRFRPYLQTDRAPDEVLGAARRRLAEIKGEMAKLAQKIVPSGDVREALALVAKDHPAPAELFATVRKQLDQARAFVVEKNLLTLAPQDTLRVIETPPFLRSQLGVAAFDGAPPLQPELGAFFYVTPFPSDWPKAKVEAKLREYNRYMLALITIHEAMPGHYVQFEHANRVQPETRRVLRWVLGSNAYIEGWASYAQELMVDAGFMQSDPKLRLEEDKLELRAVTNAILDIELHTQNLSDADALSLMEDGAYQERPEAELKLRRAKLSVTQLCSYFVGDEAWRQIRKAAEEARGRGFELRAFHDRALAEGAVPLPTLRALLLR
ncbi:MAG TPA: DUF885 domain-containing protein [Polyangia bacterium]